jgi:hypothetical protein
MRKLRTLIFCAIGLLVNGAAHAAYSYLFEEFPGAEVTNFSDISDSGLIAGHYRDANQDWTAFTFDGTSYSTFSVPGAWGTFARGINSSGVVVGEYGLDRQTIDGGAYRYDSGSYQFFTFPGAEATNFSDISDSGLVAGHYRDANQDWAAFTFDGTSYSTFSVPGAWGTFARGINSSGVVAGEYGLDLQAIDGGGFVASPVPLPGGLILVISGLFSQTAVPTLGGQLVVSRGPR